jgi:hypothetical protein
MGLVNDVLFFFDGIWLEIWGSLRLGLGMHFIFLYYVCAHLTGR